NVYASGFSGFAQLLSSIFKDFLQIQVSTGVLLFILNVPVLIISWFKIGKGFTIYSILSVIFAIIFLEVLPVVSLSDDIILYSYLSLLFNTICVYYLCCCYFIRTRERTIYYSYPVCNDLGD